MQNRILWILLLAATLLTAAEPPYIMTHFMPWNVAPPVADHWGWHWTMNHFDPDQIDADGKRQIASHYYPLTGPYDSMDPAIMEYQVLLMKLAGIDGIIVDWYGTADLWDYPAINTRTNAMFEYIDKAELKFCICYEDQTLGHLISQDVIDESEIYEQGKRDFQYIEATWFDSEAHLKIDDRPVLLNFGPQFFKQSSDWETMFEPLTTEPLFFTEDHRLAPAAVGAFSWPPMWKAPADGELTRASLQAYLDDFSGKSAAWPYRISSAFPGFDDIYKEAGVSNGYALLDADGGATFELTLEQALADSPHVIQLVTWNDYGEGTIIEPTEEFGYRYLEMLQEVRRQNIDPGFAPTPEHLRLPLQLFELRKSNPDAAVSAALDTVFELIIAGKPDSAAAVLQTVTAVQNRPASPHEFRLGANYPNPFNPTTRIAYELDVAASVNLSVFNSNGQHIATLVDGRKSRGRHDAEWDASGVGSGVYIFRLQTGKAGVMRKGLLLR